MEENKKNIVEVENKNTNDSNSNNTTNKKLINKLTYILLAVLLGGLGIHKFYAGKIGLGIVYLLFAWTGIPGLIGLIEGLVTIGKKADSDGNIIL